MRKMIITRGPQGSGKTTFARNCGFGPYRVSADELRCLLAAPVMLSDGRMGIPQTFDGKVWQQLYEILEARMARGEFILVDATHKKSSDFKRYRELAETYRYEILCVDFSTMPLDRVLAQNRERVDHTFVPEEVVRKTHEGCLRGVVPVRRVCWDESGSHEVAAREFSKVPMHDLSEYRSVMHIGDIQGCMDPVKKLFEDGFREDTFYVFVGDLLDRGIQNGEVLRFALDELKDRSNVVIVWGNHEDHLHRFAKKLPHVSEEFEERTLLQIVNAGIAEEEADSLCGEMVEMFQYVFHGQKVFVNHAGMPKVPEQPGLIASTQWRRGTGFYSDLVDETFTNNETEWVQVHGHRNTQDLPTQAAARSYNLEGKVEFGGQLRCVSLTNLDGANVWEVMEYENKTFRPLWELRESGRLRNKECFPEWMKAGMPERPTLDRETLDAFLNHELVYERPSASLPHVSAFNFTREAFFNAAWDDLNVRARGLFVNKESREIVARSYDKFFNLGERPETRLEHMKENLSFPVTGFVKENGYLGILGYDSVTDDLVFASKSSIESEFAGWFEEIVDNTIGHSRERLRRYLRDAHACMVFEVNDPVRDPHMIEYDEAHVVLLDVVRAHEDFQRVPYVQLQKIGKWFGFRVKERSMRFADFQSFERFLTVCQEPDYLYSGRPLEGFVFEDSAGFLVKVKLDFYNFWKRLRSLKDRIKKVRGTSQELKRDLSDPRVKAFHDWCMTQSDSALEQDIIMLREAFLAGTSIDMRPAAPPKEDVKVRGFRSALSSLRKSIDNGEALKPETAEKLLQKVLENDLLLDVLAEDELRFKLVLIAPASETKDEAAERLGVDIA